MKEELLRQLSAVLQALNCISVSGKQNLANLSGSIALLERLGETLQQAEISAETPQAEGRENTP